MHCRKQQLLCALYWEKLCAFYWRSFSTGRQRKQLKGSMPIFTDQTKSMNLELRDNKSIGSTSTITGCNGHSHIKVILFFSYLAIKTKATDSQLLILTLHSWKWFENDFHNYWWQNLTWCNRRILIIFISLLVGYTHLSLCWFQGSAPPHLEVIYFAV